MDDRLRKMDAHIRDLEEAEATARYSAALRAREYNDAVWPEGRGSVHDISAETAMAGRLLVQQVTLDGVRHRLAERRGERERYAASLERGVVVVPTGDAA